MNRKYMVLILVCVISIITIAGIVISFQPNPQPPTYNFEWAVSENQSFLYEVRAFGEAPGGVISEAIQQQILLMNGTTILATIRDLPSLDNITDASSFAREIIHHQKMSCEFENGSAILPYVEEYLSEGLSGCTLPIGGWNVVSSFFSNSEFGYVPGSEYLSATLYDEYLYLQYQWYGDYDDSGGWWGDSSLIDGKPLNALWQYGHQSQTIYIELTMIE